MRSEANLHLSPHVSISPSTHDDGAGVLSNAATGKIFLANQATIQIVDRMAAGKNFAEAVADLELSQDAAKNTATMLIRSGVLYLPGQTKDASKEIKPLESQLISIRFDMFDIRGLVERFSWWFGWIFSWFGIACWIALMIAAGLALSKDWASIDQALRTLTDISWISAVVVAILILFLKCIHEFGHALAFHYFSRRAGLPKSPIRVGITLFALFPFPFTDATEIWKIPGRLQRAAVGFGGVYLETWFAGIIALLWASIAPGELQNILFQLLLITGVSTLLFNLNPLVRLDGYYIFTDLLGLPNLASRATRDMQASLLFLFGGPKPTAKTINLIYSILSYSYRWVIFTGIFWVAYALDERIAILVGLIALMILIGRPIINLLKASRMIELTPWRTFIGCGGAIAITVLALTPIRDIVVLEGYIARFAEEPVRADQSARILEHTPRGAATSGTTILRMHNPTLDRQLAELQLDQDRVDSAISSMLSNDQNRLQLLRAEEDRLADQIAEMVQKRDRISAVMTRAGVWEPRAAEAYDGAWIAANRNETMGHIMTPQSPEIVADFHQDQSAMTDLLAVGSTLPFRSLPPYICDGVATVKSLSPIVSKRGTKFRLNLALDANDPCINELQHGSALVVRVDREPASAAVQVYNWLRRMAQNRIALEEL